MPADYQKIREENVARYGWDTAVLDLLGRLYSERTHFIFELIQNAEDAGATTMAFELAGGGLEVAHDGRPFTEADVRGVCGVGASTKAGDLTAIGRFGIGFKSVYAYTRSPEIRSGGERFRIEHYVRPVPLDGEPGRPGGGRPARRGGEPARRSGEPGRPGGGRPARRGGEPAGDPGRFPGEGHGELPAAGPGGTPLGTRFVFPFDHADVPAAAAAAEIGAALNRFGPRALLFLRHIERIQVGGEGVTGAAAVRTARPRHATCRRVTVARRPGGPAEDWLVWHRDLGPAGHPGQRVEVAFRLAPGGSGPARLAGQDGLPLAVFFPTAKPTGLGFVVQGPYRTTPARDNVPDGDPENQMLARETAVLLAGVLRELREDGLLTPAVLAAMPLEAARFPAGALLRPLYTAVRAALATEALIPAADGGHAPADGLLLPGDPGLRGLLSPAQLGVLAARPAPVRFTAEAISLDGTPLLYRYLRDELGVGELTGAGLVARLSPEFLAAQPDGWIAALYAYLGQYPALWREAAPGEEPGPARRQPILRLEDGRLVAPGDAGPPPAYLPPAGEDAGTGAGTGAGAGAGLPVVRPSIAGVPAARRFLESLGLAEPDLVAWVLDGVLPRYAGLEKGGREDGTLDAGALDPVRHQADLELVMRAVDGAPAGRREELLTRLAGTAFLAGENAATGERRLLPPTRLYQRSADLENYFGGNPEAWFAADEYGPWLPQLRGMGVRDQVAVRARAPGPLGHVLIADGFARHERGLAGFDPEASIDGLGFALAHPGPARSEFVWNVVLAPNRHLLAGVVESSVRDGFAGSTQAPAVSPAGEAAAREAWLPGPDGRFHRPAALSLDDLPPTFRRDEGLAAALGMNQPVVAEASRQLGIPPGVLWGLSAHPDLVALVERELAARRGVS